MMNPLNPLYNTLFGLSLLMVSSLRAEPIFTLGFEPGESLPDGALVRASAAWTPEGQEVGPNVPVYARGLRGRGLYLAGSAENLLGEAVSRGKLDSGGFTATGGARLKAAAKAREGQDAVEVRCTDAARSGVSILSPVLHAGQDGKPAWYLASAWVRGQGRIRLLAEDRAAGYVMPPVDMDLTEEWKRISLSFPVVKGSESLNLRWFSIGGTPAEFSLDALQLEPSQADAYGWSAQWIPGGTTRSADLLTLPLPANFPLAEGSITLWVQPDWALFPQYHAGYGWRLPARTVCALSKSSRLGFNGQLMFDYGVVDGRAASSGSDYSKAGDFGWAPRSWHQWTVTWKDGVVSTYLDGSLYAVSSNVTPPTVLGDVMTVGSDKDGNRRPLDGVLDEFILYDVALSADVIAGYYENGRTRLEEEGRLKSDTKTSLMALRSWDGSERIFDAKRRMSFDLTPTPDMERRLAAWQERGLSTDTPFLALFPDAGASMVSPVYGSAVEAALASGQEYLLKIGRIGFPAKANTGRFEGLPAWQFSPESKNAIVGGKVFLQPHSAHTLSTWIRIDDRFGQGPVFAEGGSVNGFNLRLNRGSLLASASSLSTTVTVRTALDESHEQRWLHVAAVYDGQAENPSLSLFLDGKEVDRQPVPFHEMAAAGLTWRIGWYNNQAFPGRIDEVVIWDKALSGETLEEWVRRGQPDAEMSKGTSEADAPDVAPVTGDYAGAAIPGEAVYAYSSFDETVQPDLACSQLVLGHYRLNSSARNESIDRSREQLKSEGKFGKGVDLFKRVDEGDMLMYNGAQDEWDPAEGAICFWFKPDWNSEGNTDPRWFWDNLWVSWMSMLQSQRIQAFAGTTGTHGQAPAYGTITDQIKAGEWSHYALTWGAGGQVELYLNGGLVATNTVPAVQREWGRPDLYIGGGSMSREISGRKRADETPRLDAVIDELLLVRKQLSAEQIAALAAGTGPASELMTPVIHFSEIRSAFRRDEAIRVPVSCFNGDSVEVILRDKQGHELFRDKQASNRAKGLELVPYALSPGRYDLEVLFTAAGHDSQRLERELVVNTDERGPVLVGTYGPWSGPGTEGFEAGMREAAVEFMVVGSAHGQTFAQTVDDYYRAGVVAVPAMHVYNERRMRVAGLPGEDYAQVDADGTWYDFASPFAPITQRYAREAIDETVMNTLYNPVASYLSLWDEVPMRADVSTHAREFFKKKTGLEPPEFKAVPSGTIVEDADPLAQWVSLFGNGWWHSHGLAEIDRELTEYVASSYPGKKTMAMPSSGYGGTSIEVTEVYPYLNESPLGRIGGKTELETEINLEIYLSSFPDRNDQKLIVLPGWLNHVSEPEFRPSLNVMLHVSMAKGCAGFCPAPMSWYWEREDMRRDFVNFSRFCRRHGAWFDSLERKGAAPLAVLQNEHNVMTRKNGWQRGSTGLSAALLPHLTTAGISYELIREEDVLQGGLDRYRGLLLISQQVMTRSVHNAIEAFAASGHKVWMTEDSTIKPAGAEILPIHSQWANQPYAITRVENGHLPIQNTTRFA
ncbi:MAG: LamG domain-containing protein, partial [Kiritimatiellia bacterium]